MGDLLIKNISDALRQSLAERADQAGTSLSEEAAAILGDALLHPVLKSDASPLSSLEALREIMMPQSEEEAAVYSEIMNEIEAKRKSDFGRPVKDFE
ncbi:FitA-like ribbon-helix-helix domain-containing protein [Rhizobium oryzicola]|uniref:Plasmid stabilization protein n=1 Tax=Rhizobium oryzicola TaxID=1232668 RepID=A0ABT8SR41_9HYPH|nr:plasmid stabilization protein [Rhizobium oryzicola]MDO1580836.1 plasmid stabilization protein [Rhizobium oryzicola]